MSSILHATLSQSSLLLHCIKTQFTGYQLSITPFIAINQCSALVILHTSQQYSLHVDKFIRLFYLLSCLFSWY